MALNLTALKKREIDLSALIRGKPTESELPEGFFGGIGESLKVNTNALSTAPQLREGQPGTGDILSAIARGFPREGASIGLVIKGEKQFIPTTTFERFVFGEEPIGRPKEEGEKIVTGFGGSKELAQKIGFPVFALQVALDFTGIGGEKNLIKILSKTSDIAETSKILRKIGVAEDIVKETAPVFAKITDEVEIARGINSIKKLQSITKAEAVKPKPLKEIFTEKVPEIPTISKTLEPLAQEARKAVSKADDLTQSIQKAKASGQSFDEWVKG